VIAVTSVSCGRSTAKLALAERDATLRQIAADYARDGDLARAQNELAKLKLANPAQLLVITAEQSMRDNRPQQDTRQLANLAGALGAQSPLLEAYLAPKPTPIPSASPTDIPLDLTAALGTAAPATAAPATAVPTSAITPTRAPTATVTPTGAAAPTVAAKAHVVAENSANLRSGPGTAYPTVGQLKAGQALDIIGRNASGDWWQLAWDGPGLAWVAGTIVNVLGPIDTVAITQNIPTPPPLPTAAPAAPAAPTVPPAPTATSKPSVDYVVKSVILRPVGQDAQVCGGGGDNGIWVYVQDPAGNRLDGVRVKEIFTGIVHVTGSDQKGPGAAHWDIYRGGGGQMAIVDDAGNVKSEVTRGMSDDWPDYDLMKAAHYCDCHPFSDAECQAALQNHTYLFATGHYTYEVVFQRTY
jgi:uncharacterized protein YraI